MSAKHQKRRIVSEVSKRTMLNKDVVSDVINEYIQVLKEEIIETGKITVRGLFAVSTNKKKAHRRRDVNSGKIVDYPETEFLSISLSKPLRDEFQAHNRGYSTSSDNEGLEDDFDAELEALLSDDEVN